VPQGALGQHPPCKRDTRRKTTMAVGAERRLRPMNRKAAASSTQAKKPIVACRGVDRLMFGFRKELRVVREAHNDSLRKCNLLN
jgi:hypothetical protein